MSRRILQIGSDILTINDKLVSVTEDYPFWKVNLDTSAQYYAALDRENTSTPYPIDITTVGPTFVGQSMLGWVTCDGIIFYSIPFGDGHIKKFNTETETLTYIGSGLSSFTGAVVVGQYIYFIPYSAASVIKLDTTLDTFDLLGSFIGSSKWGRPILLPSGKIFAPKYAATTHFELDTNNNDTITLIPAVNTGTADTYEQATWYYNGFIYAMRGASSLSGRILKLDETDYSETILPLPTFGTSTQQAACQYKNLVFIAASTYINIFDCISESFIGTISTGGLSVGRSSMLAMDGWIYFLSYNLLNVNVRLNPKNLSFEVISTNPNVGGGLYCSTLTSLNGKVYGFYNQGSVIHLLNTGVNETNNPNKKLHRLINKV